MKLRQLAHTRTGDKGNRSTLTVIAHETREFARLQAQLTPERVQAHYSGIVLGRVERFALPQLGALQFVMYEALAGGDSKFQEKCSQKMSDLWVAAADSEPGRRMMITPTRPIAVAIQRRKPTCSPRIGTESAQTHSGIEKKIAAVCASVK